MAPNNRKKKLLNILNQMIDTLEQNSSYNYKWIGYLQEVRSYIQNNDLYGIEKLIQAYGGMGSLSDSAPHENKKFFNLSSDAYDLARSIQREAEK